MNSLIVLCVIVAITGISGHTVQLTGAQNERATANAAQCIKESGVKPEVLAEAKKGTLADDEDLKKFALCFFQKAGIVDQDGKLNIETTLSKLPSEIDKADAQKLLESCKDKTGKDAADKTFEILKCYRQGAKTHIFLGFF